jgi:hypothetical protein
MITDSRHRRHWTNLYILAIVVALAITALTTGCSTNASPNTLAENQRVLATCDAAHPPASWVAIDGTGSSASDDIVAARMAAIESIARTTAACSGYLKVIVFSSSSTANVTLFDGLLRQPGATDNARLQRVPSAVDTTMKTIRAAYGPAVTGLDNHGSDIIGQYRLAGEWLQQLGGSYALHLYLLTDGFQTGDVNLAGQVLTSAQAIALAQQASVPALLPGATVTVAGLGRIAGQPPSSQQVDGLVAFYNALCRRTNAAACVSVSDYQAAGQ